MLRALDAALQTTRTEAITVRRTGLIVEHLLPQQWELTWPLVREEGESEDDYAERCECSHAAWRAEMVGVAPFDHGRKAIRVGP